jgi:ATP-binding cassette subfamily F protein 3
VLLSVSNLKKAYGPDEILRGVTFRMAAKEKVALVGRNGAGKTTLLRIITGAERPDSGGFQLARGAKLGYLRQEAAVDAGRTVLEEAQEGIRTQVELSARLTELEARLAETPSDEDLEEYALVHEHFLEAEGYSAENDVRVVLSKMGFDESEFDKPTSKLSGGEKTRLALARLLLEQPDVLILDEPTNHLDLQATEWLERWLVAYHGAVLLVSHDRAFLDATAERVLEMRDGAVTAWPGPFPKFLELKKEAELRQAIVAKRQAQEIAKLDEYVRRFMNSQRTAQARGRLKLMNRLIESQVQAPKNDKGMKAGFGDAKRSGEIAAETKKLALGFGDVVLFRELSWTVRYGERWGVIGENGAGKSTLMKVLLGLMPPLLGSAKLGAGVVAGYFSQDAEELDPEMSPLDLMVWECDLSPEDARNLLGRFLLEGDDVFRPIKTLSGGEKNKLSLARLTVLNPNLLILDEPTNHLDMASREALAEVLQEYKGTLILVSHDRWLLGQVTDRTLDVRRAGPLQYPGGYLEYRRKASSVPVVEKPRSSSNPNNPPVLEMFVKPEAPAMTPRERSKEIARLEKLVGELEAQIGADEAELKEIEAALANLSPTADVFDLSRQHASVQESIASLMSAWEEHSTRLEALRSEHGAGIA